MRVKEAGSENEDKIIPAFSHDGAAERNRERGIGEVLEGIGER